MAEPQFESKEAALSGRILAEAEKKFEAGSDHFAARGILASIALNVTMNAKAQQYVRGDSNERIVRMLAENGAEGAVYAVREDLGNSASDSTDFVIVTHRNELPTKAMYRRGQRIVMRATTSQIDY